MIGYVTIGTNNLEKATTYYDALLAGLEAKRFMEEETFIAWSIGNEGASLAVTKPFNQEAASVGNGTMVALLAPDRKTVDALYAKAIELGGTCEGKPGPRGGDESPFYAGYFRDLDGNKLNFFHFSG